MLLIAILIGVVVGLYNLAEKKGLNKWVWAVMGLVGWFGAQFVIGIILGMTNSSILYDETQLIIWGLISSLVGVSIVYGALFMVAKNKESKKASDYDDIMDASMDEF